MSKIFSFIAKKRGASSNSILLALVQCVTILTGILQTRLLSRELSEYEYGTYAQGMLVVNFSIPFLLLGLSYAVTYFSGRTQTDKREYMNTIFTLIVMLGLAGGVLIVAFRSQIQNYFDNPGLASILPLAAVLPLLMNVITAYQTMYVAENMALTIAVRNFIAAFLQISIIIAGVYFFKSIHSIFVLLIIIDVLQIFFFASFFRDSRYPIRLNTVNKTVVRNILIFSVPLAFSTAMSTLTVYMDKLMIGKMMDVEDFALYTNMAKELPFSFVISSFTTVIMPSFVKMQAAGEYEKLKRYWSKYLELGLCITWVLCGTAVACAKDLLIFLYSEKYARGLPVFIVYLLIEFCRFTYFGIILSAYGKTKVVMRSSMLSLVCNFALNIILFHSIGMIGPAVASFISMIVMGVVQISYSCKLLECSWTEIFNVKYAALMTVEIITVSILLPYAAQYMSVNSTLRLLLCGCLSGSFLTLINFSRIKRLLDEINLI